jgi:hypothetical protein
METKCVFCEEENNFKIIFKREFTLQIFNYVRAGARNYSAFHSVRTGSGAQPEYQGSITGGIAE